MSATPTGPTTRAPDVKASLLDFILAYEPPAAILETGSDLPTHENRAFIALRHQYADLVSSLHAKTELGRKKTTTELGGSSVRWTITQCPRSTETETARRVIVLAHDGGVEDDDDSPAVLTCRHCHSSVRSLSYGSSSHSFIATAPLVYPHYPPPSTSLATNTLSFYQPSTDKSATLPTPSLPSWVDEARFRSLATGIGVVGETVRTLDWSNTPLGPPETWPPELVYAFGTILHSQTPCCLVWGTQMICVYNSAYLSILGLEPHPRALGQPAREVWAHAWESQEPILLRTMKGEDFLFEDRPLLVRRPSAGVSNMAIDRVEHAYFTWTYVPIYRADGTVGGVYSPVVETTIKTRSERRLSMICQLATRLVTATSVPTMISEAVGILQSLEDDVACAAAYTISSSSAPKDTDHLTVTLVLQDTILIPFGAPAAPTNIVVHMGGSNHLDAPPGWPIDLRRMIRDREVSLHTGIDAILVDLPHRGVIPYHSTHAAALPITSGDELVGCVILYISPGQPIDDRLNDFLDLLRIQLSTSASMVASYEQEARTFREMTALDRAKTSFFTNITHELRTPLTLILGPVREVLHSSSLSAKSRKQLGLVKRNADRLLRLITTILDFATAEAGRLTATFRPTHLGPFTVDLASVFRSAVERAGLQYIVDSSHVPADLVVWVDRDKYEKIVYNLLSNAHKYTLTGSVSISTFVDRNSGRFVLEVRDTGIGIPPEEIDDVFNKFHRVSLTRGRSVEGTGIGLSYTRELVRLHKGEITVESEMAQGSVFRACIPLGRDHLHAETVLEDSAPGDWSSTPVTPSLYFMDDSDEMASISSSASSVAESEGSIDEVLWQPLVIDGRSRALIMVVDDNADMCQYIGSLLDRYCDFEQYADGALALAQLQARPKDFDLVLSDDLMPNLSGSELIDAIRADEHLQAIPVIMVSASTGDQARVDGLARGADDYLSKPFQARELILRVHTQLQTVSIRNKLELQMAEYFRELEESRVSFTRLCERLQVGIHRSDPDGNIVWANHKWKSAFGSTGNRWQNWADAISPSSRALSTGSYFDAIQTKTGFSQPIEVRIRDAAEEDAWLDVIYDLQPEFSQEPSGDLLGWVGVWVDVSHLYRLQREAVEAERTHRLEAEHSRKLQEQFIDITCHELRNPLNAIFNSASLLSESLAKIDARLVGAATHTPEASDMEEIHTEMRDNIDVVNTIVLCTTHQKRITDDVLNVSKLNAGLVTIVNADFVPCEEVKNAVRMFKEEVATRDIQLHFEQDDSIDILQIDWVRGDSGRFFQVIVNLINNAIKFTEPAPRRIIRIRIGGAHAPEEPTEDDEGDWPEMDQEDLLPMCRQELLLPPAMKDKLRLYLAVADSGLGMTDEEQAHLSRSFAQASPRTYGDFGRSGIGLFVSRMLVHLQGGKLHVQSKKCVGTVIRFFITVERASAPTSAERPAAMTTRRESVAALLETDDETRIANMRVLVVEDNMINQRVLIKLLTSLGCKAHACSNGQQCVDLFAPPADAPHVEDAHFDLVLMDIEMPVLDGISAARQIRQLEADGTLSGAVPIVAVSGNARPEWADRAREVGMNGFVSKPYGKADIEALLKQWAPAMAPSTTTAPSTATAPSTVTAPPTVTTPTL